MSFFSGLALAQSDHTADKIFSQWESSVYQIRIIEINSGSQSALGTGFFIAPNILATNYHVVSSEVLNPEQYRVEVTIAGGEGHGSPEALAPSGDASSNQRSSSERPIRSSANSSRPALTSKLPASTDSEGDEVEGKPSANKESEKPLKKTLKETDQALTILSVDVVSDLALLQFDDLKIQGKPFTLATQEPKKGEVLYSLGNPHDLGMTVVQGNYNGLVDNKFLDRIHFSGAINSGMSGGPTVNAQGEVVGINVASSGNQIGFLVPVDNLHKLIARAENLQKEYELLPDMAKQIRETTDAMVTDLLASDWPKEQLGDALILGKTVDWFECWGNSDTDKKTGILEIARGCNNADNIFLSSRFNTGFFEYEFYYVHAPDWPTTSFYRLLASNTANARPGNRAHQEQVGNYECSDEIVETESKDPATQMTRRTSYCVRAYTQLEGLYDVFFIGVTLDKNDRAIMDHFTLAGVSRESAQAFLKRFVEVMAWQ